MTFNRELFRLLTVVCMVVLVSCRPQEYDDDDDQNHAASHHDHHGRVQIKVYRGPTTHEGHQAFAPWGFWVKQPADEDH